MSDTTANEIAVIGIAGRFPGAEDVAEFWRALWHGEELVAAPPGKTGPATSSPSSRKVFACGRLADIDCFDAAFFGVVPREAQVTDPQQRLFLEVCWHAMEDAGYRPDACPGLVGVYGGVGINQYLHNIFAARHLHQDLDAFQLKLGNDKDFLAMRVSYKLNMHGPSQTVQTACSSSLAAIHEACIALQTFQCEMALAGGVSVNIWQDDGYEFQEGGILSPDGHCRPFDQLARGTVPGSGVGAVVLKRLDDAMGDGDSIYGVILGSAINNDGSRKAGFAAPSVQGQVEVILAAQEVAGVTPDQIEYVEAHGTGTALGDPIEIEALTRAFRARTAKRGYCRVGSVKANIGHLDVGAGVASFIKVVLALHHRRLPPQINFQRPNDAIPLAESPFFIDTVASEWAKPVGPRMAGISSLGIGGTNVHLILAEAPPAPPREEAESAQLMPISVHHGGAWKDSCLKLAACLATESVPLRDAAYTLRHGRRESMHRGFVVASNRAETIAKLESLAQRTPAPRRFATGRPRIAFLFPGQGLGYLQYARRAYATWSHFHDEVDVLIALAHEGDIAKSLKRCFSVDPEGPRSEVELDGLEVEQAALLIVELALSRCWERLGVVPYLVAGHSLGEYASACIAGVISTGDAINLLIARGRLVQRLTAEGGMLAVPLPPGKLAGTLPEGLVVAVRNAPRRSVVAGPLQAVEAYAIELKARGLESSWINRRFAYHSPLMAPAVGAWRQELAAIRLHAARKAFATGSGRMIQPGEHVDIEHWVRHLIEPVQFDAMIAATERAGTECYFELGPGTALTQLTRQNLPHGKNCQIALAQPGESDPRGGFLNAVGTAWAQGIDIDWRALEDGRELRVHLPGTLFQRSRYWIDAPSAAATVQKSGPAGNAEAERIEPQIYVPKWQSSLIPPLPRGDDTASNWLVVQDEGGLSAAVVNALRVGGKNARVTGIAVADLPADRYAERLSLAVREQLDRLGGDAGYAHLGVVYAVALDPLIGDVAEHAVEYCYRPLIALIREIAAFRPRRVDLTVLARGLAATLPGDRVEAPKALLLGPVRCAGAEFEEFNIQALDADAATLTSHASALLPDILRCDGDGTLVAFRAGSRWERIFTRVPEVWLDGTPLCFAPEDVVLITGGLGGIGLVLAEALASRGPCRFALVGRRADLRLKNRVARERIERQIDTLKGMGAQVQVLEADVTSENDARTLRERLTALGWRVSGIVHAAGLPPSGLIAMADESAVHGQIAIKLGGTRAIETAFAEDIPRFIFYCSSVTAELGGLGQADYCAANAYLQAHVLEHSQRERGIRRCALLWDTWSEVGMAVSQSGDGRVARMLEQARERGIKNNQGAEAFLRVFDAQPVPEIMVSGGDWDRRRLQARQFRLSDFMQQSSAQVLGGHERYLADLEPLGASSTELLGWRREGVERAEFVGELTHSSVPWLADHVVFGTPVMPAVAYLELIAAAARVMAEADAGVSFARVEISRMLMVPRSGKTLCRAVLKSLRTGVWEVVVESSQSDGAIWQTNAAGEVAVCSTQRRERMQARDESPAHSTVVRQGAEVYRGTLVGPYFRAIEHITLSGDTAWLQLRAPQSDRFQRYSVPVMDASTQGLIALAALQVASPDPNCLYLPFAYEDVWLGACVPAFARATVTWLQGTWGDDELIVGRIWIYDEHGEPCAKFGRVCLKRVELSQHLLAESIARPDAEPLAGTEQRLARMLKGLLGIESMSRHASFLDLGADSLLAVRFLARIRDEFNVEVSVRDFFSRTNIAALAELIDNSSGRQLEPTIQATRRSEKYVHDLLSEP